MAPLSKGILLMQVVSIDRKCLILKQHYRSDCGCVVVLEAGWVETITVNSHNSDLSWYSTALFITLTSSFSCWTRWTCVCYLHTEPHLAFWLFRYLYEIQKEEKLIFLREFNNWQNEKKKDSVTIRKWHLRKGEVNAVSLLKKSETLTVEGEGRRERYGEARWLNSDGFK